MNKDLRKTDNYVKRKTVKTTANSQVEQVRNDSKNSSYGILTVSTRVDVMLKKQT